MFSVLGKGYAAEESNSFDYWLEGEANARCEKEESFDLGDAPIDKEEEEQQQQQQQRNHLWRCIVDEYEKKRSKYTEWKIKLKNSSTTVPYHDGQSNYLNREIFLFLLPAMEEMLAEARRWDALRLQKCRFNGLDYLAELLWNRNPKHPKRALKWRDVFDIPQFKLLLRLHPRPIFPISWLLTKNEAALHIQRYIRGWLVRRRDDVQEMRQFWKTIAEEKADITKNLTDKDLGRKEKLKINEQIDDLCEFYKLVGKYRKI
ncbi:hypothetical protein KPH14_011825 [Odynerus spinipes]|uniref:IQ domain-containing protein K n=1 Tax=Odynerus spinipes TaxID=1348599 RepID=A0AAD9RVP4_9HYME|nr:hypothetical protein KPH14_011825 [Odynerus spinipes]